MDFHYTYPVNASADKLWRFVNDVPTVGTCIPGASDVAEAGEGSYTGVVKVRVGPISLGLNGTLHVDSLDESAKTVALTGEAADKRVPGTVRVRINMAVHEQDGQTVLVVDSEANIMGKLGEFGQGIIRRKADGIMKDFGKNLAEKVERG
jgi:carbon monoxide dehydrogenase subunit G